MMEAWRPMENVMGKKEPVGESIVLGSVYVIYKTSNKSSGNKAATIADQAIMQMLCDND